MRTMYQFFSQVRRKPRYAKFKKKIIDTESMIECNSYYFGSQFINLCSGILIPSELDSVGLLLN